MMAVEVETPEDYAGSVIGDLSSRRGMVQRLHDLLTVQSPPSAANVADVAARTNATTSALET